MTQTKQAQHTPTPWSIKIGNMKKVGTVYLIANEKGIDKEESIANSAFIVKAVNSHEKLVEALKFAIEYAIEYKYNYGQWFETATEALKQAEES